MASDPEKLNFRLVLLGSVGTGSPIQICARHTLTREGTEGASKTSILNRFLFNKYLEKYRPTVEDLFTKDFDLGTLVLRVDFLDTSGSMQFPAMRRLSITTGSAFLIVYSVDDLTSFEVAKQCIEEIQETRSDYQEIPIVFAGNKCDIPVDHRIVNKEDVSNYVFCDLPKLRVKVIECSCKDDINIKELFKVYLNLARISISTMSKADGGLKRRSSAHASGKWRLGSLGGNNADDKQVSNIKVMSNDKNTTSLTNNNGGPGGNNNSSDSAHHPNCNKATVALIKSVADATGSTINRVGRRTMGTSSGSSGSVGTNSGGPNSGASTPTIHHSSGSNDGQQQQSSTTPYLSHCPQQDSDIVISEDGTSQSGNYDHQQQQQQIVATKSQPISSHLSLNQRIKPRSRSLMRRSTRKSKVRDEDDISHCLPS